MDYDSTDIPEGYDRGRDHGPEVQQLWMNVVASSVGTRRLNTILDLGCGTGRFSEYKPVEEPIDFLVFRS